MNDASNRTQSGADYRRKGKPNARIAKVHGYTGFHAFLVQSFRDLRPDSSSINRLCLRLIKTLRRCGV
jgi:hypothetical protein